MKRSPEQRFIIMVLLVSTVLLAVVVLLNTLYASRWQLNKNGIWVRRGSPTSTPLEVEQQQFVIQEARFALSVFQQKNVDLRSGPCLGPIFQGWVADLVHVPRIPEDLRAENQCPPPVNGAQQHTLELQSDGTPVSVR